MYKKLHLKYINIGNVGPKSMGWPDDFSLKENFNDYAMEIWKYKLKPNVVLIDGRLRVLCFLITLRECKIGTKIIFDDYVSRKHYHIVEELIKPISNDGRQCLFEVNSKKKINKKKLNFLINKFNYVLH